MVTMSPKSSAPQAASLVSQVLMSDMRDALTLLKLARAGQVDPRELTRDALVKGKRYASTIKRKPT
jgi:hypothetical protein